MGKGQTVRIDVNSYHSCYSTRNLEMTFYYRQMSTLIIVVTQHHGATGQEHQG